MRLQKDTAARTRQMVGEEEEQAVEQAVGIKPGAVGSGTRWALRLLCGAAGRGTLEFAKNGVRLGKAHDIPRPANPGPKVRGTGALQGMSTDGVRAGAVRNSVSMHWPGGLPLDLHLR